MPDRPAANELRNFYRRAFPLGAVAFLAGKAVSRLRRRLWEPNSSRYYPPIVRQRWEEWNSTAPAALPLLLDTASVAQESPLPLQITGQLLVPEEPEFWHRHFEDAEVEASLHRWSWLLRAFEQQPAPSHAWGIEQVRSWLRAAGIFPPGVASEPYTVGERISNYCLFSCCFFRSEEVLKHTPPDISAAIQNSALYLASHIEYSGRLTSGNHPLNNARALLFAARLFDLPKLYALAEATLRERLEYLVTAEGFLRDGSSHYHFLITRWLLEIYGLERTRENAPIKRWLPDYLKPLIERCWFYLVPDQNGVQMPLIGDISPDLPPAWLICLPWSGFAAEFVTPKFSLPPSVNPAGLRFWGGASGAGPPVTARRGMQSFPKSAWFRLDLDRATIFWLAEPGETVDRASHAHQDLLSFVLFIDGQTVLLDPGRSSYQTSDAMSAYGYSALAHNALTIDGYPAVLKSWQTRFAASYRHAEVSTEWQQEHDSVLFSIKHSGFSRLTRVPLFHQRTFRLSSGHLSIADTLSGSTQHRVGLHYQLAPEIKLTQQQAPSTYRFERGGGALVISVSAPREVASTALHGWSAERPGGVCSTEYGQSDPCYTLRFYCDTVLPASFNTEIEWS